MTRTILLVEDNATDEQLTLMALKKSSVASEVVVVRDGRAALDHLLAPESRLPSLVLLDLNLPKVGGLDVLRELRAGSRTRSLPVVILTSSAEEDDIRRARELGSNAYVRKLMSFAEFTEALRVLAVFWLTLNEQVRADA